MAIGTFDERVCVRSRRSTSLRNPENTFLVLYGADEHERKLMFSHKEMLKSFGFKYFRETGTYSLFSGRVTPQIKAALADIDVDFSGYEADTEAGHPTSATAASCDSLTAAALH